MDADPIWANENEIMAAAWAAMGERDWDEALRCWAQLRQFFPQSAEGYVWPISALTQAGRHDEADEAAITALEHFPNHPEALTQYAWVAMMRGDHEEAGRRWTRLRESSPERIDGYSWGVQALWVSGRLQEAETLAQEALQRFPDHPDALVQCARVASQRLDWTEALRRWERARHRHPDRADAHTGLIHSLRMLMRADDAEAAAAVAIARFADDPYVVIEHIWTAAAREDWPEAGRRFEAARQHLDFGDQFIRANLGTIEYRIGVHLAAIEADDAASAHLSSRTASGDDGLDSPSPDKLMLAFESIGERCDFGAVQRHYGVEPLGLLRFAYTPIEALLNALNRRFESVGTEEGTDFHIQSGENVVVMREYGMVFHTFVYGHELPSDGHRAAFPAQQVRRLAFLKNKLLGDLEDAEKIFVYAPQERASDEDAKRLLAALRLYGRNTLLYVRAADDEHPDGTVEVIEDALYAGYVTRFANFLAGEQPPAESWRAVCAKTHRLWRRSDNDTAPTVPVPAEAPHARRRRATVGKRSALHPDLRLLANDAFSIGDTRFRVIAKDYHQFHTTADEVIVLKDIRWFEYYGRLIRKRNLRNLVELGIFEGGSALLFALLFPETRILAIDIRPPDQPVLDHIARLGLGERITLCYGTPQEDRRLIEAAVARKFGAAALDMVIDDCSHQYLPTRASFEVLFPLLRSGGVYIIEDWAWAHWEGSFQNEQWIDAPALTNLAFELTMLLGSDYRVLEKLEIRSGTIAAYKAAGALSDFSLSGSYRMRGKTIPLI